MKKKKEHLVVVSICRASPPAKSHHLEKRRARHLGAAFLGARQHDDLRNFQLPFVKRSFCMQNQRHNLDNLIKLIKLKLGN